MEEAGSPHGWRSAERLVDQGDLGAFDDGRSFLARGEGRGLFAVGIDAGEFFAVSIVHGHLPVFVFAPAIFGESRLCRGAFQSFLSRKRRAGNAGLSQD